jgi:hypothetical protein
MDARLSLQSSRRKACALSAELSNICLLLLTQELQKISNSFLLDGFPSLQKAQIKTFGFASRMLSCLMSGREKSFSSKLSYSIRKTLGGKFACFMNLSCVTSIPAFQSALSSFVNGSIRILPFLNNTIMQKISFKLFQINSEFIYSSLEELREVSRIATGAEFKGMGTLAFVAVGTRRGELR